MDKPVSTRGVGITKLFAPQLLCIQTWWAQHDASWANLVYLLNCGASAAACRVIVETSTRHATRSIWRTTCSLVDLHHDRVHNALEFFLLGLKLILLGELILIQPVKGFLNSLLNLVLVIALKLVLKLLLLEGVAHGEAIVFQAVLGLDLDFLCLVLGTVLLGLLHHAVDFSLGKTALLVGDGNLIRFACGLVLRRHIENTIGINVESDLDLWDTTRCGWDSIKVKLAQQVVVLGHGTLSLEDLNQDARLIVSVGGKGLRLLCWNRGVALDQLCHDTTGSFQAHGQWSDIQKQEVLNLGRTFAGQDCCLDCCAKGNSLVWVDGLARLLAIEELLNHGLHFG